MAGGALRALSTPVPFSEHEHRSIQPHPDDVRLLSPEELADWSGGHIQIIPLDTPYGTCGRPRARDSPTCAHICVPSTAAEILCLNNLLPPQDSPAFANTFGEVGIRDFGKRRVSPQGPGSAGPMAEAFRRQQRRRCASCSARQGVSARTWS
jgi:hypothetical protein